MGRKKKDRKKHKKHQQQSKALKSSDFHSDAFPSVTIQWENKNVPELMSFD